MTVDGLATDRTADLDELLAPYDRPGRPGLVVGLARGGTPIYVRACGLASIEHNIPLSPRSVLRIGSVSKHLAVVLALLLEAEGRLSLDDEVRRHWPELSERVDGYGRPMRIRHLCDNTSGICDFLELLNLAGAGLLRPAPSDRSVEMICRQGHLNCVPGERLVYSAGGFLILSKIIERVCGMAMADLLEQRLFGPLGMRHSRLAMADHEIVPDRATPYLEVAPGAFRRGGWGLEANCEGGIVSTLEDMMIWADALLHGRIAGPGLLARMAEPATYAGGGRGIYGLGLATAVYRGRRVVNHGGRTPGFRAEMALFPDDDLAIVILANHSGIVPFDLSRRIADRVLADRLAPWPVPRIDSAAWAGRYVDETSDEVLELAAEDGGLAVVTNSGRFALYPCSDRTFRPMAPSWDMLFDLGGTPGAFTATDSGQPMHFRRVGPWTPSTAELDRLVGTYRNADLPADYHVRRDGQGLGLCAQGRIGHVDYALEPVAPGCFIGLPLGPYAPTHRPTLRFVEAADGPAQGLRVTTDRTKALRFDRVPEGLDGSRRADAAAAPGPA